MRTTCSAAMAIGLGAAAVAQRAQAPIPAPAALADLPRLGEQSVLGQDAPAGAVLAPFAFGDGVLLAVLGERAGAPALRRLDGSAAATLRLDLTVAGRRVPLPERRVRRVRGTDVFLGEDRGQDFCVRSVSAVHAGALWQCFEVDHGGAATASDVRLSLAAEANSGAWSAFGGNADAAPGTWHLCCGDLAPGARQTAASVVQPGLFPNRPAQLELVRVMIGQRLQAWQWGLALGSDAAELPDFVRDATAGLLARHAEGIGPVDAAARFSVRAATGPLLAYLGTGLLRPAREILDTEARLARAASPLPDAAPLATLRAAKAPADGAAAPALAIADADAASWIVLHHYWYLRATNDPAPVRAHWPLLQACVERLPPEGAELAPSMLRLQATAALGSLLDGLDRIDRPAAWSGPAPASRPGAAFAALALERLAAVERRFWCDDHGLFAPRLAPGGAPLPAAAATENLLPCWIGMLTTTGDKTARNVATTLARLGRDGDRVARSQLDEHTEPLAQAMAVVALTQFDGEERGRALARLLAMCAPAAAAVRDGAIDVLATGAAVDAARFAVTGLRIAAGPGLDEDWLRLSPMLPPAAKHFECRGLQHDGCRADLWVDRVDGPLDAAERAANEALPPGGRRAPDADHQRTRFALGLRALPPGRQQLLTIVQCEGVQFEDRLGRDETATHTAFVQQGRRLLGGR